MSIIDNHNTFLDTDLSEFEGKWIAIVEKKVVASNKSLGKVLKEVEKDYPDEKPLVAKAPTKKTLIL